MCQISVKVKRNISTRKIATVRVSILDYLTIGYLSVHLRIYKFREVATMSDLSPASSDALFFRAPPQVPRRRRPKGRRVLKSRVGFLAMAGGRLRYCDTALSSSSSSLSSCCDVEVTGRRRERSRTKEQTRLHAEWRGEKVNG